MIRSDYQWATDGDLLAVVDLDRGGRSVTNDIDNVLSDMRRRGVDPRRYRVVYRDSMGQWDEVCLRDGRFERFRPAMPKDIEHAQGMICKHKPIGQSG